MVHLGDAIEIESSDSSPELTPHPATYKSRGKLEGKGKATPHRLGITSSVIEIPDSESEADDGQSSPYRRARPSHSNSHAGPGPSSPKRTSILNSKSYPVRPTGSLDNIFKPPQQNLNDALASGSATEASCTKQNLSSCYHDPPPYLSSDDEHKTPLTALAHIGRIDVSGTGTPVIEREPTILMPETQSQIFTRPTAPDSDPIPFMDPTSTAVAQILEVLLEMMPNFEPAHLLQLIETNLSTYSVNRDRDADGKEGAAAAGEREVTVEERVQGFVGRILHLLFENPDYPETDSRAGGRRKLRKRIKAGDLEGKRKGKGRAKDSSLIKPKIDYASIDRPFLDPDLYDLQTSFPHNPKPYSRRRPQIHRSLYAPTGLAAEESFNENKQQRRSYAIDSSRNTLKKSQGDVAMEDKAWLDAELAGGGNANEGVDETWDDANEDFVMDFADDGEDDGTGIECQCCFADFPFSKMVQCPEAHLFCSTCISTYASTQLGAHNSSLTCIHPSSCSLPFPKSELKRILSTKLYELYERLEQQKEIRQADLVGLEECPFCEWKCVVEVSTEEDNRFRCGNEEGGCGVVSCRGCKKLNHFPKSCKEVEEEKHLNRRHAIEEAMTRALMRNCPNCQKAFIKEYGCNMMSCPNCHTSSCYICRQVVNGYSHFDQLSISTSADVKNCSLWDAVEKRHAQEVKEAAEKAMEEYEHEHPDIDESTIKVDHSTLVKEAAEKAPDAADLVQ